MAKAQPRQGQGSSAVADARTAPDCPERAQGEWLRGNGSGWAPRRQRNSHPGSRCRGRSLLRGGLSEQQGSSKASTSFRGDRSHSPGPVAAAGALLPEELAGDETQRGWLCSASHSPALQPLALAGGEGLTLLAQEFALLLGAGSPLGAWADPAVLAQPL